MKTNIYFWSYLAHFFLEWEMFRTKFVVKIKTHILCSVTFFPKIEPFMRKRGKIVESRTGHRRKNGAGALHAGYLRLQTHSEYVILIALHCNNGCTNTPRSYVIRTLPVFLKLIYLGCPGFPFRPEDPIPTLRFVLVSLSLFSYTSAE